MPEIASFDIGLKNLALCIIDTDTFSIKFWGLIDLRNASAMGALPRQVKETLDNIMQQHMQNVLQVIVEKQPGRNGTMLRVESYVAMYFVMRGLRVNFISPYKKLSHSECSFRGSSKERYSLRKKAAIALAEEFINKTIVNHDAAIISNFKSSKKKDDLADSLLQVLGHTGWWTSNQNQSCGSVPKTSTTPETNRNDVYSKVNARRPTEKQSKSGRFSVSNIKYFVQSSPRVDDFDALVTKTPGLKRSISTYFSDKDECYSTLQKSL
jgi:Poxvirus A22 protein